MTDLKSWENRKSRFYDYLNKLYFSGRLKLSDLNSFRNILEEIDGMMVKLLLHTVNVFGIKFGSKAVKNDLERLNSVVLLLEYNVSLISSNLEAA